MIDALRRASASRITAVIPYFGYARQDRRVRSERVPISAKLVAEILQIAGANRIMTLDLHSDQIQGFFNIPVDNIYVTKAFLNHINRSRYPNQIIGDVKNKTCIIIDDIIDTAGTLCNAAYALKEQGAQKVYAYISHPVLSGSAIEKISKSKLDSLIVTDTIPLSKEAENCKKIKIVSMDSTLAGAITRVNREESISEMFL